MAGNNHYPVYCVNCRRAIDESEITCPYCGQDQRPGAPNIHDERRKKAEEDANRRKSDTPNDAPSDVHCVSCGNALSPGVNFCPKCGKAVDDRNPTSISVNTEQSQPYVNERNPLTQSTRNAVICCMTPVLIVVIAFAALIILAILGSLLHGFQ